jgi:small subunit ribosomal protein S14
LGLAIDGSLPYRARRPRCLGKEGFQMAKKSTIAKAAKKLKLAIRHKTRRDELKAKIIDPNLSDDDRRDAMFALAKLPRDSSYARTKRRCAVTGASRAVYRKFKLNRITFRNMALAGLLPGVTKASW